MDAGPTPPLVLLSGLAADCRIFAAQKVAFPQLNCPRWLCPDRHESLDDYAHRMASLVGDGPCVIGGASFGGIVALHMARHLNANAVILIGSVKTPSQLPLYARCAQPLRFLVPAIPVRLLQLLAHPFTMRRLRRYTPFVYALACQFRDSDPNVFKWSLSRILDWSSTPAVNCPVYHLHGDRDWTLLLRYTDADAVVAGGGHVLTLSHPNDVNSYIRSVLHKCNG